MKFKKVKISETNGERFRFSDNDGYAEFIITDIGKSTGVYFCRAVKFIEKVEVKPNTDVFIEDKAPVIYEWLIKYTHSSASFITFETDENMNKNSHFFESVEKLREFKKENYK